MHTSVRLGVFRLQLHYTSTLRREMAPLVKAKGGKVVNVSFSSRFLHIHVVFSTDSRVITLTVDTQVVNFWRPPRMYPGFPTSQRRSTRAFHRSKSICSAGKTRAVNAHPSQHPADTEALSIDSPVPTPTQVCKEYVRVTDGPQQPLNTYPSSRDSSLPMCTEGYKGLLP